MNMPSAVAEQAKQVEQYYESLAEDTNMSPVEDKGGDPESPSSTEPQGEQEQPKQTIVDNESEESYKKRFSNFKAKADETIHNQREQLRRLEAIEAENQRLQQALSQVQQQKSQEAPKFSKEALDNFSQEELTIFNQMVEDRLTERTSRLEGQVEFLTTKLQEQESKDIQRAKQNEHLSLRNQVVNAVPDFDSIDKNPQFKAWLQDYDAYGTRRMDAFRQAQATKDVARIISFYNDFKQIQEPPKVDPRELQQVPSGQGSSSVTDTKPKKQWNQLAINEFYKNAALGKYSDKQRQEIEQEITNYYNELRR